MFTFLWSYLHKVPAYIPCDGHCSSFTLPVRARHHGDYFQKRSDLAGDCMVISHWGAVCPRPPSMRARTRSNSIFRISVRNQYEQYAIAKFCPNQIKHVGKQHSEWYWLKLKITETSSYQFLAWTCQSCGKHIYSEGGKKKITVLISRLKCSSLVSAFWNCHP